MVRHYRTLVAVAIAAFVAVGCSQAMRGTVVTDQQRSPATSEPAKAEPKADDATAAQGSVEDDRFSLTLPAIPFLSSFAIPVKARVRVFEASANLVGIDCVVVPMGAPGAEPGSFGTYLESGAPASDAPLASSPEPGVMAPLPRPVYETEIAYRAGHVIGPVKLPMGEYVALVDILVGPRVVMNGRVQFVVAAKKVSVVNVNLSRPGSGECDGGGDVIISPVVPGVPDEPTIPPAPPSDPNDGMIDACSLPVAIRVALCKNEIGVCQYREHITRSQCGDDDARAGMQSLACSLRLRVPTNFLSVVRCVSIPLGSDGTREPGSPPQW